MKTSGSVRVSLVPIKKGFPSQRTMIELTTSLLCFLSVRTTVARLLFD
jgi:hypothetical protein